MAPLRRAVLRLRESIISRLFRPLRFGIVGLLNTVLGLAVIFAAKALLGLGDFAANLSGYGLGLMCSFLLNRSWTFRHEGRAYAAFWRFGVAFAVAYGLNLATVFGLRDAIGVNSYLAQACGVVPYTISFYLMSAYYVFPAQQAPECNATTKMVNEGLQSMRGPRT
jgi:putative flippase GtrA